MFNWLNKVYGALSGRSPKWPATRKAHLAKHPCCEACGGTENLNAHHVIPYHIRPDLELDPDNIFTLCEGSVVNCHLLYGHLRDWKSFNVNVKRDAREWREKIEKRP